MPAAKRPSKSSTPASKKLKKESVKEATAEKSNGAGDNTASSSRAVKLVTSSGESSNLKITSWNVNGIRANLKKDGFDWMMNDNADIICLQELKCAQDVMPDQFKDLKDYHVYWNNPVPGYSGVAVVSKVEPMSVKNGIGVEEHDKEGRTITAEYEKFFLVTTYVPNSKRKLARLEERQRWDIDFQAYIKSLDDKKPVVLCGDMNVSHLEIDLANPKTNKRNAGFTQEERDGLTSLLDCGFIDSFRHLYPKEEGRYTFWTAMRNARARNVGWRLDYFILSSQLKPKLCDSVILDSVMGSDHCPVSLYLSM